jgi:hypothetical protein
MEQAAISFAGIAIARRIARLQSLKSASSLKLLLIGVFISRCAAACPAKLRRHSALAEPAIFPKWRERRLGWVAGNADVIREREPIIPEAIVNRAADNWAPLLAIAEVIGGRPWPDMMPLAS